VGNEAKDDGSINFLMVSGIRTSHEA